MGKYTLFGAEVRKELLLRGKSVKWLADQLEVSSSYLIDILKGNRKGTKIKEQVKQILDLEEVS